MSIAFDHVQYITDGRMILGEASSDIQHQSPFTDMEFYRSQVDPGFNGNINFLEGDLFFEGGVDSAVHNVTWKWQIKSQGQGSWTDLHTAVTEQWTGGKDTGIRVGLDASALGGNTTAPFEIRLILTDSQTDTVHVRIGGSNKVPAVRVIGETV
jgi:hypothetical protein